MQTRFSRRSGILLHPTSLPGPWGIGDLGGPAYRFIDFLFDAGQSLWQILPLVPTGFGNSPYQSPSAFAGNPLLISPERLVEYGLLTQDDLDKWSDWYFRHDRVDYDQVVAFKLPLLQRSFEHFLKNAHHSRPFADFCETNADWLDDYALFMALRDAFKDEPWDTWDRDIAARQPAAMERWRTKLSKPIQFQQFMQYVVSRQWLELKDYANQRGIQLIGDAPIFVALDSADVWAAPDLFYLDSSLQPTVVAGVPPDYFSETGQRWGNPLYQWEKMANNGYEWWIRRFKCTLALVDIVRLDHFRGFEAYWEVPESEPTAINGRWVTGPGSNFFEVIARELGDLPIIAEDLGLITEEVTELRLAFNLPGMKVLHFAFGDDATNPYLPHNYETNCVVYSGTHDNDTTIGWFRSLAEAQQEPVQRYLGRDGSDIAWDLIRLALSSVADTAIIPLQDVLRLGSDARMNIPGTAEGNWTWRYQEYMITRGLAEGLRSMVETYGRSTR
ncbi:MAG: 4-alpha-glucanotransferase [Chloroflexaceae bacterium]|nr:4-alpha-glucanotransferase [Chloroflexaceae bacterium]